MGRPKKSQGDVLINHPTGDTIVDSRVDLTPLIERLDLILERLSPPSINQPLKDSVPVPTPVVPEVPLTPVPLEYRNIVDDILNKDFNIQVLYRGDTPEFEFVVGVPKKYSNVSEEQLKNLGGQDIRPKVISLAEGINGVRSWSERVFNSFSPEVRAQIIADRI